MQREVLGKGLEGCIIFPAFGFFEENNCISKIGTYYQNLFHEYEIYQNLPKSSIYFDKDEVHLLQLNEEDKNEAINLCNNITENSVNLQLIMPKYKGVTLDEYLLNYKFIHIYRNLSNIKYTFDNLTKNIMSEIEYRNLLKAFLKLCNKIKKLHNDFNFTHGDLNSSNLIYNPVTNKFQIIDFGFSFFGNIPYSTLKYKNDDNYWLQWHAQRFAMIGTAYPEIREYMIENKIFMVDYGILLDTDIVAYKKYILKEDLFNFNNFYELMKYC